MERRAPRPRLHRPRQSRSGWRGHGQGGSTATPPPTWSSRSSGRRGRPGTAPTSAARPRSSSPRPLWSPTGQSGSSSPRTSPPAPPTGARRLLEPDRCARTRPVADLPAGPRGRGRPHHPARRTRGRARPHGPLSAGAAWSGSTRPRPPWSALLAGDGALVVVEGAAAPGRPPRCGRLRRCWRSGVDG